MTTSPSKMKTARTRRIAGFLLAASCALAMPAVLRAQSAKAIRINEVLVNNQNNYVDNYGRHGAWIELYNSSAGSVNLAGCFLTNDLSKPTKYAIPSGDVKTLVKPYQQVLFWTDDRPGKGTFHVDFALDPGKPNVIAFFEADGKTLVDSVTVPANVPADLSYGRIEDGNGKWAVLTKVTPDGNNKIKDKNAKVARLQKDDPDGVAITIISMAVVFIALIIAYLIYRYIGKYFGKRGTRRRILAEPSKKTIPAGVPVHEDEAVYAAIALALMEANGSEHEENGKLTLLRDRKTPSPWSSKIQTMRRDPR